MLSPSEAENAANAANYRLGERAGLNFQNRNGFVPPYQARQLIEMIVKYQGSAE